MITAKEKEFLLNLKDKGYDQDKAYKALSMMREKDKVKQMTVTEHALSMAKNNDMYNELKEKSPSVAKSLGLIAKKQTQQQEVLERRSPTVARTIDTFKQFGTKDQKQVLDEKLMTGSAPSRPGTRIDEAIEDTIGEIPYIGGVLESLTKTVTSPVTTSLDIGAATVGGTIEAAKGSLPKFSEAVENFSEFLSFKPGTEKKGMEALTNLLSGTIGTVFAPVSGAIEGVGEIPLVGSPAKKGLEGLAQVATPSTYTNYISDKVAESKGLQVGTPEYAQFEKDFKEPLAQAFDLLGVVMAPKAMERMKKSETGIALKEGAKAFTEPLKEGSKVAATQVLDVAKKGIEEVPIALKKPIEVFKKYIQNKSVNKFQKTQNLVRKEIDTFLESKSPLARQTLELERQGTKIREHLSTPEIFNGLKVKKDGRLDPTGAVEVIDKYTDTILDAKREILPKVDEIQPPIKKELIKEQAYKDAEKQGLTDLDTVNLKNRIDKQLEIYPEEMTHVSVDDLRRKSRNSAREARGTMKSNNEYAAIETAARTTLFESLDNLPFETNGAFTKLSQYTKELIDVKKFLEKNANRAVVTKGKMSKLMNKTYGAVAGSAFGPVGSIAGAELLGAITDIMNIRQLGNTAKSGFIKKMFKDQPEAMTAAFKLLKDIEKFEVPRLEAPKSEYRSQVFSGDAIEMTKRSQSTIEGEIM